MPNSRLKVLLSPFAVLFYVYVLYFLVVYGRFYRYVFWDLMNLGTRIIGVVPRPPTLILYTFGGVLLCAGFLAGSLAATSAQCRRVGPVSRATKTWLQRTSERVGSLPGVRNVGLGWALGLVGWGMGLVANLSQIALSGGASLADIGSRWGQSPVIVFLAASQILFVPALVVSAKTRRQRVFTGAAFVISVMALGMLGARNLPAKLIVATFLATVIVSKPRNVARIAITFLVMLVAAMGIVGAISKAGIYGASASAGLVVALTYSDSLGTVYSLDRIVALTPPTGIYKGKLLKDSFLSLIPGVDAEYAAYQIGRYLGGRSEFVIDGVVIERSVSLAPTMLGAPYADNGVLGVAVQMLIVGGLFGYLQTRARRALWTVPVLVLMASYVVNGVNAGVYGPNPLFALILALIVCLADALIAPGEPEVVTTSNVGEIR